MEKKQQATGKVKIPFVQALGMILHYVRNKIIQQIKSVALIVIYLVLFQTVILRVPNIKCNDYWSRNCICCFWISIFYGGHFSRTDASG